MTSSKNVWRLCCGYSDVATSSTIMINDEVNTIVGR